MFLELAKLCLRRFWYSKSKGIVLETYGAGNAPTEDWFLNLEKQFQQVYIS
jgi:L-asparaginase/Glu-tRNA(Gln) amidotransferase subunit D